MRRSLLLPAATLTTVCAGAAGLFLLQHHRGAALARSSPPLPAAFADIMPHRVVWAWEEPEDLHTLPSSVGVAYLAETLLLGQHTTVLARRQPLHPADGASLMAVVRLETRPGFADTLALRREVAQRLRATVDRGPAVRALQIDFDATAGERAFYAGVLAHLRPLLPEGMPLSITALASWCGPRSWLHELPVHEAVPMMFRMGGPRAMAATAPRGTPAFSEPLCRSSLGVSTDEPWPRALAATPDLRLYVFAPRPWTPGELATVGTAPRGDLERKLLP